MLVESLVAKSEVLVGPARYQRVELRREPVPRAVAAELAAKAHASVAVGTAREAAMMVAVAARAGCRKSSSLKARSQTCGSP